MSWKTTLYDYVHHRNQTEFDYSIDSILPYVRDSAYLEEESARLLRKYNMDQERGLLPSKKETRLSIMQTEDQGDSLAVDVKLSSISVGSYSGQTAEERRIEQERLTLCNGREGWYIARIEQLQSERAPWALPPYGEPPQAQASLAAVSSLRSPSNPLLSPQVQPSALRARYDRAQAAAYADTWWEKGNPAYLTFEVDCTNYVSQCLFAGGAPMNYTGRRESGWWFKGRINGQEQWSFSWAVAHSLCLYLTQNRAGLRAEEVDRPELLEIGDVICYDWDGDGRFQHNTIVTAKDPSGMPLVNAHTANSKHRYWSYQDSPSFSQQTKYRFLHIVDSM